MIRRAFLLIPLALAACSDGSESGRPEHMLIATTRQGLYAIKAAPGGALAKFSDVRLFGKNTVCGTVDAQDGGGLRRFGVAGGDEPVIEGSGDATAVQKIGQMCRGLSRGVTSRNPGYSDIQVDKEAR